MKHVFFVHSHITYLASLSVICHLRLSLNDVIIVSSSYIREKPLKVININNYNGRRLLDKCKNYFYPYRRTDTFVKKAINDGNYTLYIGWNNIDQRYLMTHPKCKGINFIEEGLSAYWNNMTIKEIIFQRNPNQRIRSTFSLSGLIERVRDALTIFRGYNSAIQSIPNQYFQFCSDESINYYGFDKSSFWLVNRNKHVMNISDLIKRFNFNEQALPNKSIVYISDYNASSHSSLEEYTQELDSLINYLKANSIEKVFVKWHYKCNQIMSDKLTKYLKKKYNGIVEILPTSVVMEIVFLKSKFLTVLGNTSSLLFYASIMGHDTLSFASSKNLDFKVFWEKIKLIKDESQF